MKVLYLLLYRSTLSARVYGNLLANLRGVCLPPDFFLGVIISPTKIGLTKHGRDNVLNKPEWVGDWQLT